MKVIGICGGSGSGKTTLLKRLAEQFGDLEPTIFSMDNYYKPIEDQFIDENGQVNFDLPDSLHRDHLFNDLKQLKNGEAIEIVEYQFNTKSDKTKLITLQPSKLLIVEGIFLFHYEEVRSLLDFSIFVDVELETQLDRRLYRDQESRGYSRENILYQWHNHVLPCYQNYLEPYRPFADFCFKNDHRHEEEFQRLLNQLPLSN